MVWPPQNTGLFASPECIMCCTTGAALSCGCQLQIPITGDLTYGDPYANVGDATAELASQTVDCIAYTRFLDAFTSPFSDYSADNSVEDALTVQVTFEPDAEDAFQWASFSSIAVDGPCDITFTVSETGGVPAFYSAGALLLNCSTLEVVASLPVSVPGTDTFTDVQAGEYVLCFIFNNGGITNATTVTFSAVCSMSMVVNNVVANFDEGGETRQLEACPRLELPADRMTGDLDAVYADKATAEAQLAATAMGEGPEDGGVVVDCKAYFIVQSGTWTAGVTTDTFSSTNDVTGINMGSTMRGCLHMQAGSTLTVSGSVTFTGTTSRAWSVVLRNGDGSFAGIIDSGNTASDTIGGTFAISETGRYILQIQTSGSRGSSAPMTSAIDVTVSSDDDIFICTAVALYDRGLICPARLECE